MRLKRECSSILAIDIVIKRGSNYSLERGERWLGDYVACEVLLRVWVGHTMWEKVLTAKIKCSGSGAVPCDGGCL